MLQLEGQARAALQQLDTMIGKCVGTPQSLAPGSDRTTTMVQLGESLVAARADRWQQGFADALSRVVRAQLAHFPRNLFWDQDFLAAEMIRLAVVPEDLRDHAELLAQLQALFGEHSPIRFRYLHDFSYGFDWSRWVAKAPVERRDISPFAPVYLAELVQRGREIEQRIEAGDADFPALPPGQARNPFLFSREPDDEARLLQDLARLDLIPVQAWRCETVPRWQFPFGAHRQSRARTLAIPPTPQSGGG